MPPRTAACASPRRRRTTVRGRSARSARATETIAGPARSLRPAADRRRGTSSGPSARDERERARRSAPRTGAHRRDASQHERRDRERRRPPTARAARGMPPRFAARARSATISIAPATTAMPTSRPHGAGRLAELQRPRASACHRPRIRRTARRSRASP